MSTATCKRRRRAAPLVLPEQSITVAIAGMACGRCIRTVSAVPEAQPGVTVHRVALGFATITLDPELGSPSALVEALRVAGYSPQFAAIEKSPSVPRGAPFRVPCGTRGGVQTAG